MSTFQISPRQEIQGLTPFVIEHFCWCFKQKTRKTDFVCQCKQHLFPRVCLLYFPRQQQNHPFTHLRHAISQLPSSRSHPPKAFPIHSQQHSLSNCSGQRSRPDIQTGNRKKCRNYSDQVRLDDGKQGKRRHERRVRKCTHGVGFTLLLVLIAVIKNGQLKTCPKSQTHLDFITAQI